MRALILRGREFLLQFNTKTVGGSSVTAALLLVWTTTGIPTNVRYGLSVFIILAWLGMPSPVKTDPKP